MLKKQGFKTILTVVEALSTNLELYSILASIIKPQFLSSPGTKSQPRASYLLTASFFFKIKKKIIQIVPIKF